MVRRKINKKGQFYLIAAIIIVMAISGIASVKTYTITQSEPRKIQDISSELNEEGGRIIDYGVYNSGVDLTDLLDSFTDTEYAPYFLKKTEDTDIVFIYGNENNLQAVTYNVETTGTVSASIGGTTTDWVFASQYADRIEVTDNDGDGIVFVTLLDNDYNFTLKDNEMFYFIIAQEREGETYVERN